MDSLGDLYGTTSSCGDHKTGTVWKVNSGNETVLYSFCDRSSCGHLPWAGVVLDSKGNLYGDTMVGGTSDSGTVWKLNQKDVLTTLHNFDGGGDGGRPFGLLIMGSKGTLYGAAYLPYGTVWKLTP